MVLTVVLAVLMQRRAFSHLHDISASQVVVEEIMRQQHLAEPCKVIGLLVLQPQDFGRREARHQGPLPQVRQLFSLFRALHITPQFGIPDDLKGRVQRLAHCNVT